MKKLLILLLAATNTFAQEGSGFKIFNSKGKEVSFKTMMKELSTKDVILFGEHHDNPISHYLQLQGLLYLENMGKKNVAVGMEMLEKHHDKYLKKYFLDKNFKAFKDSTDLWVNFKTDYKPVVDSAFAFDMTVFTANITRKYASLVFKKGLTALDTLSTEVKQQICPLPFPFDSTLTQYQELISMGKSMHASGINFAYAQAIKDATMAYWIVEYLKQEKQVYFLNGSFHSDFYQGIFWYIQQYKTNTTIGTITTVEQVQVKKLEKEHLGKADFIIVVDETMTKTH